MAAPTPSKDNGRGSLQKRLDGWWPTVLRYAGLTLVTWEVVVDNFENPAALVLGGGMMGLKDVLNK